MLQQRQFYQKWRAIKYILATCCFVNTQCILCLFKVSLKSYVKFSYGAVRKCDNNLLYSLGWQNLQGRRHVSHGAIYLATNFPPCRIANPPPMTLMKSESRLGIWKTFKTGIGLLPTLRYITFNRLLNPNTHSKAEKSITHYKHTPGNDCDSSLLQPHARARTRAEVPVLMQVVLNSQHSYNFSCKTRQPQPSRTYS